VKAILQIALGIIAAIGGFVDIGDLVFNAQAGAEFGYELMWAVPLGVVGIALYAEMCGRVAAVTGRPVFDVIRMRLGLVSGLVVLVASLIVNLLTVAAEIGGVGLILELFFDAPFTLFAALGAVALVGVIWFTPFEGIERIFGYAGLALFVFVAAALKAGPDLPVLLIARDRTFMGEHSNGPVVRVLGWVYFVVLVIVAVVAIPLLLATNAGGG
jgi:Mn2+/Fe2+ NRAMP family transporter